METCIRGFSFMPDNKFEVVDLQYIEEDELERTWKSTRRERLKKREQKIWEEFVKEKDIVGSVFQDDKYQFLEQMPESDLNEMMESELKKMKEESKSAEICQVEVQEYSSTIEEKNNDSTEEVSDQQPCVTFAETLDKDDCDVFHIFDEMEQSGLEEESALNDSMNSPPTVRERHSEPAVDVSPERPSSDMNTSSTGKSSENVTNVIETSIYCAKVKELRIKINDEILEIINTFDRRDIFCMEREDISRMIKRSAEFCTRFNRIYMYQLQRQMHDIKRNNNLKLPFAKHTQFQSQMIRVVSLHQNLLQAFQVFHKSVEQTWFERESSTALRALVGAARNATAHCTALSQPRDLPAAYLLYNDDVITSCDKLEEFVNQYTIKCEQFLNGFVKVDDKRKSQNNTKKRQKSNSTGKSISDNGGRLSMYSLDKLRVNSKSSNSKDTQSGSGSYGAAVVSVYSKTAATDKNNEQPPKSNRKSPRCRRPLMRDPQAGQPRPPRAPRPPRSRDYDISTMVEQVEPCASSHASRDTTPEMTHRAKLGTPRTNRTPRKSELHHLSRKPQPNTPRRLRLHSPKFPRTPSPKLKSTLNNILSDKSETENVQLITANKIPNTKKRNTKEDVERDSEAKANAINEQNVVSPRRHSPEGQSRRHISPDNATVSKSKPPNTPRENKKGREGNKVTKVPEQCEVSKLLKQLCSGDASGNRENRTGSGKNAQLLYMTSSSPRPPPTTPQLLRILEETIQKKLPKSLQQKNKTRNTDKYRLSFNLAENVADNLFQYRTKFVQHMLTSPMYANSDVGKPWEMIGSVSEQIIDEVIQNCVKEMELADVIQELYKKETT